MNNNNIKYTYSLFLDDERTPDTAYLETIQDSRFLKEDWVIVRSYKEFINTINNKLNNNEFPKLIAFDHDLADIHYTSIKNSSSKEWNDFYNDNKVEKTGFHTAKWLVNFVIENNLVMPQIIIHSRNSGGAANIKSLFDSYYKLKNKGLL